MTTFRTRARTVDLLGRQQIAGLPTAIHELFKNAHDAYADHVEVDYFREDRLFILRDDGVGMTREEFEERWLVVGTESKVKGTHGMTAPPIDEGKAPRPVLGEKGIGRLAIGIVGDSLLVLSRAIREGRRHPLVAAFLHWELFSLPSIDLDEIPIPVREIDESGHVDSALVDELVAELRHTVDGLASAGRVAEPAAEKILRDLAGFRLDPWGTEAFLPGPRSLRLSAGGRGTQFWVFPANDIIDDDLDPRDDRNASRMQRQLLGFADTMTPGTKVPVISTAFRDHRSPADVRDVLAPEEFFTSEEFRNADHYISGRVDERGCFAGDVSVFGEVHEGYVIPFHEGGGHDVRCGPFEVHLAYVQGERRHTTLPDQDWWTFHRKAARFGGVYVYIDGIRVLPYGRPDVDWLEIEERRSKSALYYFFSHRRMCGAVLLERGRNNEIREKAGREGFVRNAAYRDLIAVLKNLLLRLVAEFFREEGAYGEEFLGRRAVIGRLFEAEQRRSKGTRNRRKKLAVDLARVSDAIERGEVDERAHALGEDLEVKLEGAFERHDEGLPAYLHELEREARASLDDLRASYRVTLPRVGLTKTLDRDWRRYRTWVRGLEDRVVAPLEARMDRLISDALEAVVLDAQRYERLLDGLKQEIRGSRDEHRKAAREIDHALRETSKAIRDGVVERKQALHEALYQVEARLPELARQIEDEDTFRRLRASLIGEVRERSEPFRDDFRRMRQQLTAVSWDAAGDLLEQLAAVEQQAEDAKARLEDELEATQLGMAVEILSHELDHTVHEIRQQLRELKLWADSNPELARLHSDLRLGFEHLDGYLALFTPLRRRLYRSKTVFDGAELCAYLRRLFRHRLEESGTELTATPAFGSTHIFGYPSTYYPIFVNLVDNSLWWTKDRADARILLDAEEGALLVHDNGPGVAVEDRDLVFEPRFSLKPGGRGLGLTISRDAIRKAGGDLRIDDTTTGGATFRIVLPEDAIPDQEET